ncbi:MAG TPA: hypothetical protein VL329_12460 [Nitrospiraceae bacterium]|nr:hypothetical protein [Nitrospiraceae bacterium]
MAVAPVPIRCIPRTNVGANIRHGTADRVLESYGGTAEYIHGAGEHRGGTVRPSGLPALGLR